MLTETETSPHALQNIKYEIAPDHKKRYRTEVEATKPTDNRSEGVLDQLIDVIDRPTLDAKCWQQPILFNTLTTPEIPANLLPDAVGIYVSELSAYTETPPALAVMVALSVLSTATRGRVFVELQDGYREPTNIYTAVALPSGNRKSAVFTDLSEPLTTWEKSRATVLNPQIDRQKSKRRSEEVVIEQRRRKLNSIMDSAIQTKEIQDIADAEATLTKVPVLPKLYATDTTPESLASALDEQNGVFAVLSDEGGIFDVLAGLYSNGVANIDVVLKGWDRGSCRIRRKDREIDISPCLTLGLSVQPITLSNFAAKRSFQGRGLAERILFAIPKSTLGYRKHDKRSPSQQSASTYRDTVQRILNDERNRVLTLSVEAEDELREFRQRIESMLRPTGKLAEFAGWGSKLPGQLARIAGLMHLVEQQETDQISLATMTLSLDLGALLIDHAIAAFGEMGIDQATSDAQQCWQWISGRNSFTRGEISSAKRHVMKKERITAALTILAEQHLIDSSEGTPTPGTRERTYLINPLTGSQ